MKVLILGGDGYLGWPTAMYLSNRGWEVAVVDNYFRRLGGHELNMEPLVEVPNMHARAEIWKARSQREIGVAVGDITDYSFLEKVFRGHAFSRGFSEGPPDAVVHYAEQPSAPYSMMDREKALFTLYNNLVGTANLIHAVKQYNPDCHIVKLGTMGVYGSVVLHLIKRPKLSTYAHISAAVTNIFLNWLLIPRWGISGAAVATCASFGLQCFMELYFSARHLFLRLPFLFIIKSLAAGGSLILAAGLLGTAPGSLSALLVYMLGFSLLYAGLLFVLRGYSGQDLRHAFARLGLKREEAV